MTRQLKTMTFTWHLGFIKQLIKTVVDFFTKLHKGSLPSYDSIIRVRRFLNQHYPDTRGTSYMIRKNRAEKKRRYFGKKG